MSDVMIDLETLDVEPSAVILSIGAVKFDPFNPAQPFEMFHIKVDIDSQPGRSFSGRTIEWWVDQDVLARKRILEGPKHPLPSALVELARFVGPNDRVWGNGATFDISILENAYNWADMQIPWKFYNVMCYRTMKNIYADVPKPPFEGVSHDALSDALHQAKHLQSIMSRLQMTQQAA